jgi:hypothetical protein
MKSYYTLYINLYDQKKILGIGDGDWGLGIGPNPQSPIPNPQKQITKKILNSYNLKKHKTIPDLLCRKVNYILRKCINIYYKLYLK